MGIKGLWNLMSPYSEKKSLHEIRGETVAVDLSGWVCDSQNVTDYNIQPKLYLRNLFFRTVYLLLADIQPVFVLEGDAPELKRDVMAARSAIQFRGAPPKSDKVSQKPPNVTRRRFKGVQKECETLLKTLGVRCIKGRGEAEATCARLNAQGIVDAVVSQDSDCFAYGARRVYRNFSVSGAAGGGALQGSVDCYDADKLFDNKGFGRKKMVALAILCGCDYGVGACGSSINTVLSFLDTVLEDAAIPRLLSWVTDPHHYEERARWIAMSGRCDRCGHIGRTHAKNGCSLCATHRGCEDNSHKNKVAEVKRELALRNRALSSGMPFPEPKVMKEFMDATAEDIDLDSLKIPAPSLIQFVKFMSTKLDWPEKYCVEKFLPVLTKWHLQDNVPCRTIKPITIKKKRNPRGVPSYEVLWGDVDGQYEGLIPDDQFEEGQDVSEPWISTERQDLMRQYYPDVVDVFEESIKKPPKVKKTRTRKKKDEDNPDNAEVPNPDTNKPKRKYNRKPKKIKDLAIHNINESLKKLSMVGTPDLNSSKAHVSLCVNKLKRKFKSSGKNKHKNLDSYVISNKKRKCVKSFNCSFKNLSAINNASFNLNDHAMENKVNINHDNHFLSMLNMSDGNIPQNNLSDLIEKIVTKAPVMKTAKLNNNVVKLIFERNKCLLRKSVGRRSIIEYNSSTPKNSPIRKSNLRLRANISRSSISKANTSYFFDKLTDDRDAFEMSLEYKHDSSIVNLDCDTTIDYSLPDVCL